MHKKIWMGIAVVCLLLAGALISSMADFDLDFTLGDGTDQDVCIDFDLASPTEQFCWIHSATAADKGFQLSHRLLFDSTDAAWDNDYYLKVKVAGPDPIYYQQYDKATNQTVIYSAAAKHIIRAGQNWEVIQGQNQKKALWSANSSGFGLFLCDNIQCIIDGQFNALGDGFSVGGIVQKGIALRATEGTSPFFLETQDIGGANREFRIAPGIASGSSELQWFTPGGSNPSHTLHKASGQPDLFFHSGNNDTTEFTVGTTGYGFFHHAYIYNIVASTTQTQAGGTALRSQHSFIDTVANNGDAVTIAFTDLAGREFKICNGDFTESMQVFPPASREFFGQGNNNPVSVLAGECLHGIKGDPDPGWTGYHWWI